MGRQGIVSVYLAVAVRRWRGIMSKGHLNKNAAFVQEDLTCLGTVAISQSALVRLVARRTSRMVAEIDSRAQPDHPAGLRHRSPRQVRALFVSTLFFWQPILTLAALRPTRRWPVATRWGCGCFDIANYDPQNASRIEISSTVGSLTGRLPRIKNSWLKQGAVVYRERRNGRSERRT
jgi:hypothetical protein